MTIWFFFRLFEFTHFYDIKSGFLCIFTDFKKGPERGPNGDPGVALFSGPEFGARGPPRGPPLGDPIFILFGGENADSIVKY